MRTSSNVANCFQNNRPSTSEEDPNHILANPLQDNRPPTLEKDENEDSDHILANHSPTSEEDPDHIAITISNSLQDDRATYE